MATLHSPNVRATPASTSWYSPRPTPKLRDSCHACASSKVRCSRDKPTCARCAKRGLECVYLATKRAGRKHDRTNSSQRSSGIGSGSLTPPNTTQSSSGVHTSSSSDTLPSGFSPMDTSTSSTALLNLNCDFDDFIASPFSYPLLDPSEFESYTQSTNRNSRDLNNFLDFSDAASLFIPEDAFSAVEEAAREFRLPASGPRSPPNSRSSTTTGGETFQTLPADSTCGCLISALCIMKQLFPTDSRSCTNSNKSRQGIGLSPLPAVQYIITENARTVEALSSMLQCSCSQDSYLLAISSFIVFKVLGWYAAAARGPSLVPTDGQSPTMYHPLEQNSPQAPWHTEQARQAPATVGHYSIDREEQGRMAAQLVLSELHRAHGLINVLSKRLKARPAQIPTPNSGLWGCNTPTDTETAPPFSAAVLDNLEAELRRRLRSLSMEIVDMLRQG